MRQRKFLSISHSIKIQTIIFHTYHDSLLAGHQGLYHTAMTIRKRFFIHNMLNKRKRYIKACHIHVFKNETIDIKHIPATFGGYQYLLVITCDQTNFTISTPLRRRDAQSVREASIYRVIYLFDPPRQIMCDKAMEFTSHIVQAILHILNCKLKVICPYNHGSSKVRKTDKNCQQDHSKAFVGYRTNVALVCNNSSLCYEYFHVRNIEWLLSIPMGISLWSTHILQVSLSQYRYNPSYKQRILQFIVS